MNFDQCMQIVLFLFYGFGLNPQTWLRLTINPSHNNKHCIKGDYRKFKSWNKSYNFLVLKKSTLRLSVSLDCANQNEILEGDHSNQDFGPFGPHTPSL